MYLIHKMSKHFKKKKGVKYKHMKLNILERVFALQLLPKENNLVGLRMTRELVNKIDFSAEELKKWNIKYEGPQIKWGMTDARLDEKGKIKTPPVKIELPQDADINLSPAEVEMLKKEIEKKDKENKLDMQILSLAEKLMDAKV